MFGFELENHNAFIAVELKSWSWFSWIPNASHRKVWKIGMQDLPLNQQMGDSRFCEQIDATKSDFYGLKLFEVCTKHPRYHHVKITGEVDHNSIHSMVIELISSSVSDFNESRLIAHLFSVLTECFEILLSRTQDIRKNPYFHSSGMQYKYADLKLLPSIFQEYCHYQRTRSSIYNDLNIPPDAFTVQINDYWKFKLKDGQTCWYSISNLFLMLDFPIRMSNYFPEAALRLQGTVGIPLKWLCADPNQKQDPISMMYTFDSSLTPEITREADILKKIRRYYFHKDVESQNDPQINKIYFGLCAFLSFILNVHIFFGGKTRPLLNKNYFFLYPKSGLKMILKSNHIEGLDEQTSNIIKRMFFTEQTLDILYVYDVKSNKKRSKNFKFSISHFSEYAPIQADQQIMSDEISFFAFAKSILYDLYESIYPNEPMPTHLQYGAELSLPLKDLIQNIAKKINKSIGHRISYDLDEEHIVKFELRQPPIVNSRKFLRHIIKLMSLIFIRISNPEHTKIEFKSSIKDLQLFEDKTFLEIQDYFVRRLPDDSKNYFIQMFTGAVTPLFDRVCEINPNSSWLDDLRDIWVRNPQNWEQNRPYAEIVKLINEDAEVIGISQARQLYISAWKDFLYYLSDVYKAAYHY